MMQSDYKNCAAEILEANPDLKRHQTKVIRMFWIKAGLIWAVIIALTVYLCFHVSPPTVISLGIAFCVLLPLYLLKPYRVFRKFKGRIRTIKYKGVSKYSSRTGTRRFIPSYCTKTLRVGATTRADFCFV